jgi:hypothetical protein
MKAEKWHAKGIVLGSEETECQKTPDAKLREQHRRRSGVVAVNQYDQFTQP